MSGKRISLIFFIWNCLAINLTHTHKKLNSKQGKRDNREIQDCPHSDKWNLPGVDHTMRVLYKIERPYWCRSVSVKL